MGIKENIKILRKRYDLTQEELAEIAGVTHKAVSTWELGTKEPRMGAIEKIANHFGLKKSHIIEENGMDFTDINVFELSNEDREIIRKYNKLDSKGKHTVNAVLNVEYERCTKPHLEVVAAHSDDYSEEQQKLMQEDIDDL